MVCYAVLCCAVLCCAGEDNLLGQTADFPGVDSLGGGGATARRERAERAAAVHAAELEAARAAAGGRHIVLTVDDSEASERACMWAVQVGCMYSIECV